MKRNYTDRRLVLTAWEAQRYRTDKAYQKTVYEEARSFADNLGSGVEIVNEITRVEVLDTARGFE